MEMVFDCTSLFTKPKYRLCLQLLVLLLVTLATAAPGPEAKADAEPYHGIACGLAAHSHVYGDLYSNHGLYYGKREANPQRRGSTTTTTTTRPEPGSLAMASARPTLSRGCPRQLSSLGLL